MRLGWKKVPESIKNHKYSSLYKKIWNTVHNLDQMSVLVYCGAPGKGKTNSMASMAHDLDRDSDDVPRYDPTKMMCYQASKFSGIIAETTNPAGRVLCLDDAEIVLYNKESLKKIAVEIGKILATMRFKNFIVMMTIPHFKKLESHARSYADYFCEVIGRDKHTSCNIFKIQELQTNAYSGEIYRHNIRRIENDVDPMFNLKRKRIVNAKFMIPRVPSHIEKEYKKIEYAQKQAFISGSHKKIVSVEDGAVLAKKAKRFNFSELVEIVRGRIAEVMGSKNRINKGKIMLLKDDAGKPLGISEPAARDILSILREEQASVEASHGTNANNVNKVNVVSN